MIASEQDCPDTAAPHTTAVEPEISIVMPCLNEAATLEVCIRKARRSLEALGIEGEVVVADNGSSDGSQGIAILAGARLVTVARKGYGSALQGGIAAARGTYVIIGDADDSYDFSNLKPFVDKLRGGCELVMGNRFKGGIRPGAMPALHRYLGNPVLTALGKLFFHSPCGDFHCGLRGFDRQAIGKLDLRTMGMEYASEMVVKATLHGLRIAEVPTTLSPDGRDRPPHLRTWRDGWRHLRFLLLYSPRWLFLYPGIALMIMGLVTGACLLPGPVRIGRATLDIDTLMYAGAAVLIGFQAVTFSLFTVVFATAEGLLPDKPRVSRWLGPLTLEAGICAGTALIVGGLVISLGAVWVWGHNSFGDLDPKRVARLVVPAVTTLTLGFQVLLSSFFLGILKLRRR
ncbi:MAG TPA: glycosyltransferase family 2 protein [Tepidisphaeraceae bacterium]|nr:glycosyltransferase family 2 protein [Tepidisphaeraceae bacterium]